MNEKLNAVLCFITGAAIGSAATWMIIKKKYENIAQEEIDSVKEIYLKRNRKEIMVPELKDVREKANMAKEKPDVLEYAKEVSKNGYKNYADIKEMSTEDLEYEPKPVEIDPTKPYRISPDEFGENSDYNQISLTYYYANKVVADENDDPIEDVEETVGFDSLNYFGEYEDDSVFVRNERLKCDFEILLDHRDYNAVPKRHF